MVPSGSEDPDPLNVVIGTPTVPEYGPPGFAVGGRLVVAPVTVMVRVGGLGSFSPIESTTVSDATYVPGVVNVTEPGLALLSTDPGLPPGNTPPNGAGAPSGSKPLPANVTAWPAETVTLPVG